MKEKAFLSLMFILISTLVFAQGEMDAIRYSRNDLQGTARVQAMSGAFGALGGDASSISINPAGLGIYHSSEVSTTLGFTPPHFVIDNFSYIGRYYLLDNESFINFGFTYKRLKDFNKNYSAPNKEMNYSLTDYIVEITNGIPIKDIENENAYRHLPWLSVLGWDGWFFNPTADSTHYESILHKDEKVNPALEILEKGHIDSYDFSVGTDISDQVYLGAMLSLTDIFYNLKSNYTEDFGEQEYIKLKNLYQTTGTGCQLILGAIWRPIDFLRLGIAYHSPAWYYLTDTYEGNTTAKYATEHNDTTYYAETPSGAYTNYYLNTPSSWVLSAAGILEKKALISFDCEIKDYTQIHLSDEDRNTTIDNEYIKEDFKRAFTLRAGIEYRFTPQLSGRWGYSWVQNPYEANFRKNCKEVMIVGTIPHYTIEGNAHYFTAGIGYRFSPQFYIDIAFVYKKQKDELYYFPTLGDEKGNPAVEIKNNIHKSIMSIGYKF